MTVYLIGSCRKRHWLQDDANMTQLDARPTGASVYLMVSWWLVANLLCSHNHGMWTRDSSQIVILSSITMSNKYGQALPNWHVVKRLEFWSIYIRCFNNILSGAPGAVLYTSLFVMKCLTDVVCYCRVIQTSCATKKGLMPRACAQYWDWNVR